MALDQQAAAPRGRWRAVESPIFVVGAARSGTTLLRNLLSAHSRIAIAPETHFMRLAEAFGAARAEQPAAFEQFWSALQRHLQLRATAVDLARCRELLEQDRRFRSVFAALLAVQAESAGKARAGEKSPGHEHHLARLFDWFPGARAIFVQRDPRACAASALLTPWVGEQVRSARLGAPLMRRSTWWHVAFKAQEWNDACCALRAWSADPRVATVAYERLVQSPTRELERLCDFLGERFEPGMIDNRAVSLIAPDKDGMRWRDWTVEHERRAAGPISVAPLERWRTQLSPAEIGIVEGACAEGMAVLGYAASLDPAARRAGAARFRWVMGAEAMERSARQAVKAALGRPVAPDLA